MIIDIYVAHVAEASKCLETEGRVEMTWDDVKLHYTRQYIHRENIIKSNTIKNKQH